MQITERTQSFASEYRYGFNGMEEDGETNGNGNALDFGARIYDSRLGRWLSLDPASSLYTNLSPYGYTANCPIWFVELDGRIFDLSTLSESDRKTYEEKINKLKENKEFAYYYNALELSTNVVHIEINSDASYGGKFNSLTNTVTFKNVNSTSVIVQELFHAYQNDKDFYDINEDAQNIETEGDLITVFVLTDMGYMAPVLSWQDDILGLTEPYSQFPSLDLVSSEMYRTLFIDAATKRQQEYVKQEESSTDAKIPASYLKAPSEEGPSALEKVIMESDPGLIGPRMGNGDFYSSE